MLDERLCARLEIHRTQPGVDDTTVETVAALLADLAVTWEITDETAGIFVSHLVSAITRIRRGEHVEGPPAEVFRQIHTQAPAALGQAAALAAQLTTSLNIGIPTAETEFLAIHLATLPLSKSKEKKHEDNHRRSR